MKMNVEDWRVYLGFPLQNKTFKLADGDNVGGDEVERKKIE
jgi:hypothetical protein